MNTSPDGVTSRERETKGYEPFALHTPLQWAIWVIKSRGISNVLGEHTPDDVTPRLAGVLITPTGDSCHRA